MTGYLKRPHESAAPSLQSEEIPGPVAGKFRRVRVNPIQRVGQYRGTGSFELTPEGLKISGRHVLSPGARWGIGLGLFFGSLILSSAITGGSGYCAPGFIPIYFLVEYFVLKREEILVPYSEITRIGGDAKHSLVGIQFESEPFRTPAVLSSPRWKPIYLGLKQVVSVEEDSPAQRSKIDENSSQVEAVAFKPWSKSKLITRSVFVGTGWYFLFYLLNSFLLMEIFSITGIGTIPEIRNLILRILVIILRLFIPGIPTYFLTRRYYRKKSDLMAQAVS
jgi:hypothetical protein